MITPNLSQYMGDIFEDVCRQYVRHYWHEKIEIAPTRVGAHWDSELEIDIVTNNIDESIWFGECKWWKSSVGENVLNQLIEKVEKLSIQFKTDPKYMLFSSSGFTDELTERATNEDVYLFDLDDLYSDNN